MEYTKIAWYELTSQIMASGTRAPECTRLILLTSETLYHGIVVTVRMQFSPFFDNWSGPAIGYANYQDPYAPKIFVWFRLSEYQYYYDILRQETPVYYGYSQPGPSDIHGSSYFGGFELITHKEPTGEGSAERLALRPVLRLDRVPVIPVEMREIFDRHTNLTVSQTEN